MPGTARTKAALLAIIEAGIGVSGIDGQDLLDLIESGVIGTDQAVVREDSDGTVMAFGGLTALSVITSSTFGSPRKVVRIGDPDYGPPLYWDPEGEGGFFTIGRFPITVYERGNFENMGDGSADDPFMYGQVTHDKSDIWFKAADATEVEQGHESGNTRFQGSYWDVIDGAPVRVNVREAITWPDSAVPLDYWFAMTMDLAGDYDHANDFLRVYPDRAIAFPWLPIADPADGKNKVFLKDFASLAPGDLVLVQGT